MKTITEEQLITLMRITATAVQAMQEHKDAVAALDDAGAERDATKFALNEALENLGLEVKAFFEAFGHFD